MRLRNQGAQWYNFVAKVHRPEGPVLGEVHLGGESSQRRLLWRCVQGIPSMIAKILQIVMIHLVLAADENPLLGAESNPFSLCKAAGQVAHCHPAGAGE